MSLTTFWQWLHVTFVVFTVGPVTAVTMASPRAIRRGEASVLRYLSRATRLFALLTLAAAVAGVALAGSLHELSRPWLTTAMTLYVVALVCLLLIMRDQRRALAALAAAPGTVAPGTVAPARAAAAASGTDAPGTAVPLAPDLTDAEPAVGSTAGSGPLPAAGGASGSSTASASIRDPSTAAGPTAAVERGRIASLAGLTALIWLVILLLMAWRP